MLKDFREGENLPEKGKWSGEGQGGGEKKDGKRGKKLRKRRGRKKRTEGKEGKREREKRIRVYLSGTRRAIHQ